MQAYTPVPTRLAICALLALAFVSCGDWQPLARSVQPELVLAGEFTIVQKLDATERYVLLKTTDPDKPRFSIVDMKLREACELPASTVSAGLPTTPPMGGPALETPFLLAVRVRTDDGNILTTSDAFCELRGSYGRASANIYAVTLDGDKRGAYIYGNGSGLLSLVDPWSGKVNVIADKVGALQQVARVSGSQGPLGPQALWLIEDGALTQRGFDGTLYHAMGENVTKFDQATYDTVRITYVDGNSVYEAAGPDYEPFLVAENGCEPFYYGTTLNLFSPCTPPQLQRFDLLTGTIEEFPPGVTWSYTDSSVLLEYALVAGEDVLFETRPGGERTQVMPTLYDVQVVDRTRLAGRTRDRRFGIWSSATGFQQLFENVVRIAPFVDVRQGRFLWLMMHNEKDGYGDLSVFDQTGYDLQTLATSVPVRGYSVEFLQSVPEPIVVSVEDVAPGETAGFLRARLLSGEFPSAIDDDVTSYELIAQPLPGLIYTINQGPKQHGLWFAAL